MSETMFNVDDKVMLEYGEGRFISCKIASVEAKVFDVQWYEIDIYGKLCPFGVAPEHRLSAITSTPADSEV